MDAFQSVNELIQQMQDKINYLELEIQALKKKTPTQWFSVKESALALAVSEKTIRRKVASGELVSRRVGSRVLVLGDSLLNCSH